MTDTFDVLVIGAGQPSLLVATARGPGVLGVLR